MNRFNFWLHALKRLARGIQSGVGTAGIAGIALLAAAGVGLVLAGRAHRQTERLTAQTGQAHLRVARQGLAHVEDHTPAEQLARFQQWFPLPNRSTEDLRVIFAAAQAAHVDLARGEYSLHSIDGSGGLERFEVILPVKEHYAPVKTFVAEVLNKLPHASLDELRVERPASGAEQLESRVHFTLFYREHA